MLLQITLKRLPLGLDFPKKRRINTSYKDLALCNIEPRYPAGNYMFKVNNRNTRTRCEICSKLTIKTHFTPCSSVSIVNFEHLNAGWVILTEKNLRPTHCKSGEISFSFYIRLFSTFFSILYETGYLI